MAKLIYDGTEYGVAEADVPVIKQTLLDVLNSGVPSWTMLSADGSLVQLLISPGVSVTLISDPPSGP